MSEIEKSILRSQVPITISEAEEISILGQHGIWLNKKESDNWKGEVPLSQYPINMDSDPEILTKKSQQNIEYVEQYLVRYLRPPTPPGPGEILIQQQNNILTPPAPPIIIRQQPLRSKTPEPLIIRERPPKIPSPSGSKVIIISGKRLPPPPRKVIVERLAALPNKPQSIIIERWLPYKQQNRRVIFQKSTEPEPVVMKPKNIVVQWNCPEVKIRKTIKYLGVVRANPSEYVEKYGPSLKTTNELPNYVLEIKPPNGVNLEKLKEEHVLEGDLEGFKYVNLEREGLGHYRDQLEQKGVLLLN